MSYSLDVEHFIREIEKRPAIWHVNSEESRHKGMKLQAWEEVARNFIPDFGDMTTLEKEEVYRKLHGKWRNIRDSYVRNKKKRPGQRSYMYAKHLNFLDNVYKSSDKQSDKQSDDDAEWADDNDRVHDPRKKRSFTDTEYWQDDSDHDFSAEDTRTKKVKKEDNPLEYFEAPIIADTSCSFPTVEDEDKSFFDSLLPTVRSFDIDQKLEFRSEVLNLLKKIRKYQK
ncbi:alcohol dehydrogenase transcription factor myb/SANT-like domain-containing protein [Phthorimaea operculella]|nr:alcohol dehydrogenase transcription factor myb/SANT-like domain-containing protein [Phthorimaea operculella]